MTRRVSVEGGGGRRAGGNVVDTASGYGASEEITGEVLAGRRDRYVVASKYTMARDPDDPNAGGNQRKNLVLTLEQSLRRLRTDYLDVYWVHIWDRHTPIEETVRALDDAVRAGKILHVGISDAPAWVVSRANTLAEWRGWTPFAGVQVPYSLLNRDIERELLPMAEYLGLSIAAWGPLAGGVLTGKHAAGPVAGTRREGRKLDERERTAARAVQRVAADLGATPSQVALAWTRAKSPAVQPIIGASDTAQLADNLGAVDLRLPEEAVRALDEASGFAPGPLHDFLAGADEAVGAGGLRLDTGD
ncbi:aldo/keto reductase [Nocardiopsis composta]|uniref:Aryl-alcohol dehydrogenase-like predicted oxidoreductase n=1 Tax=Nocardiopsis composta TaxID=157465 RepID=A0A7W8VFI0_9ACTN|nr:aryl-alcohol dehydrogenase-like predicted oxidoreductase [Nocardiopsis composta]